MEEQKGEMVSRFTLFIKRFKIAIGDVASKVGVSAFRTVRCKHTEPNPAPDPSERNLLYHQHLPREPPEPDHDAPRWELFGRSFQHVSAMQGLGRCCGFIFFFFKSVQKLPLYHCYVKNCQLEV